MRHFTQKPILVFSSLFVILAFAFFLFPINLFDGEMVYKNGLVTDKIQCPISLSYFIGMGYDKTDMTGVKDFYLLPKGYAMAFIFILGIPALAAYRVYLGNKQKNK